MTNGARIRPTTALRRAALVAVAALLALLLPAAAGAYAAPVRQKLASGPQTWIAEANIWQQRELKPVSWWGHDDLHARYYSNTLGRFVSVDPRGGSTGNSQSWNRYAYVLDNPIRHRDPRGTCVEDLCIGEGIAAYAAGAALVAATVGWLNAPAPGDPSLTNQQVIVQSIQATAHVVAQAFRKATSPDRYKAKDQPGRDKERAKQERREKKEGQPKPAPGDAPPSPGDLISPGPLRIPPGAGNVLKFAQSSGQLPPGGGGGSTIGPAIGVAIAVALEEVNSSQGSQPGELTLVEPPDEPKPADSQ